jgi:drug/metabolite transporter (DMT)-like permease
MSQLLALASAAFYGLADFTGGFVAKRVAVWTVTAWSMLIGASLLIVGLFVVPADRVTAADVLWGALAGVAGLGGLMILYATLATGTMSVVAPITGATSAVVPVVFDLALGSALTGRQRLGVAFGIGAVLLVGTQRGARRVGLRIVGRAIAAGALFGLFFIALSQASSDSGLWPLVGARAASIPLAFGIALAAKALAPPRGRDLWLLVAIGGLDMSANIAIARAIQTGPLGVNAVLSSLYPVATALAAIIILRERPTALQITGVGMAVGAIVALAL